MKILVVDDNHTTNFYNKDVLEEMGIFDEIEILSSGQEAIDYFQAVGDGEKTLPDVCLLDIKMPDYDGFEVLDEIDEIEISGIERCLICMLTTSKHKRDLESFEKSRTASRYLNKPLEPEMLISLLKEYDRIK